MEETYSFTWARLPGRTCEGDVSCMVLKSEERGWQAVPLLSIRKAWL